MTFPSHTSRTRFSPTDCLAEDGLFEVREGAAVDDAVSQASAYLHTASELLVSMIADQLPRDSPAEPSAWAAIHIITSARALLIAVEPSYSSEVETTPTIHPKTA